MSYGVDRYITIDDTHYTLDGSSTLKIRQYTKDQLFEHIDWTNKHWMDTLTELKEAKKQIEELKNRYEAMRNIAYEASTKLAVKE